MNIINFTHAHISEAAALALSNYEEERRFVSSLPLVTAVPDLAPFADNGFGVAAFEGEKMVGFLGFYSPWDNVFTTYAKGTFSPIHGHGSVAENRENIYKRLYQAAADKLVTAGVSSHAIVLYAHEAMAQNAFFTYGFGLRCIDAVREMELIKCNICDVDYNFCELNKEDFALIYPLHLQSYEHFRASPIFMHRTPFDLHEFLEYCENGRYFGAFSNSQLCGYMFITNEAETFITKQKDYTNITGAYCLPEHRGKGVYQNLLNFTISTLKAEGYTRLGVDFESFNPTAYGFWLKYFTAYTHSVVRRIDEKILENS